MGNLSYAEASNLTAIASAIRSAKGTQSTTKYLFPTGFVNTINTLTPMNADDGWAAGTLPKIYDSTLTSIGSYAFCECTKLSQADFPNVTSIYAYAFAFTSLKYINFPKCTYVGYAAFSAVGPLSMSLLSLPLCSYIGPFGFYANFTHSNYLESIYLPECLRIESYGFHYVMGVSSIYLPKCSYLGVRAFLALRSLTYMALPKCEVIDDLCFLDAYELTTISLPYCSKLSSGAFAGCSSLQSVYLLSNQVASIYRDAFRSTHANLKIYVPASLLSSYRTTYSSNTSISSRFVGI